MRLLTGSAARAGLALHMAVVAGTAGAPRHAAAAEPSKAPPGDPARDQDHDTPLPPGKDKRPPPAYAEPPRDGAAETALWVPRVLLFPLYVSTEYGLRRPAGALYTWAERNRVRELYYELFTFDEEQKVGLFPTFTIDLGLRATAGLYFVWLDAFGDSDFRLRVTTGGLDLWTVNSSVHTPIDRTSYLRSSVDYARRPDSTFYGLGRSIQEEGAHYLSERFVGRESFTRSYRHFAYTASGGVVAARFDPGPDGVADESLADALVAGRLEAPPALEDGVLAVFAGLSARFDSRPPRRPPLRSLRDLGPPERTGFTLAAHATQFSGLRSTRATRSADARLPHWLRYGGMLGFALDLTGTQRTLELNTAYAAVEPLPTDNLVPFTEQVSLGGSYPMRAFTGGRLIDESAIVSTISYNWPLLPDLDGSLHYSVGNVFANHLSDFDVGHLRSSFGIGMETVSSLDYPFEILVALGTKPFEEGGDIDTVRFVMGTSAGF